MDKIERMLSVSGVPLRATVRNYFRFMHDVGWKLITTAPKDGTKVLLALKEGFKPLGVVLGRWSDERWQLESDRAKKHFFAEPTHWMSLPQFRLHLVT